MVKLANNTYFQLGVFMSSAMVVQTIGWNQSTNAVEFNHPLSQQLSSVKNQELPLASVQAMAKPPSLIHQVKQGDTITKIASEYQVSSDELIELNQIQNSNVIFVDQRLQIPTTATQNNALNSDSPAIANLVATTNSRNLLQPNIKQTNVTNVVPSAEEDPYIANLRAEIDQLRAQYKREQERKVNGDVKAASVVSVADQQFKSKAKSNSPQLSTKAKLNSPSPQRNFESNLTKRDLVALKLPPLSNSEEYLPNAFDGYAWPAQGVLTSGFGWRWGRMHQGVDIAAPIGTPVLAAASGTVVGAGWHDGFGNLVKLEHLDGSVTYYGHNNRILVTPGQQVTQGEQVAEMGSTGYSTGSHLHFEVHLRDQEIVDPLTLLSKR
jgi:murein DD-endopeptidase MepM/ murein hydrolase activator NlpD